MAGASAVQVGTAIRSSGPTVFTSMTGELKDWLDVRGHASLSEVRGILVGGGDR